MQFDDQFDFDCAAATLLRMFSDPGYYRAKYERLGGPQPEFVAHKLENDVFTITVRHVLTVADLQLPSFARKLVGETLVLRQTDTWQLDSGRGQIDVEIESKPITTRIDLALDEQGHGTRLIMAFTIAADLPLIGNKVERALADGLKQRLHDDLQVTAAMVEDYV
ncbi:MAG TPA: DUF2505 domain-containing protein [Salinisphaeraceae bacterium]|nr:DUF2505 domain-containing protein [Salinisphaeraceae bacterium]